MKINILTDRNFVSFYFFYPLLVNFFRLRDLNLICEFHETICPDLWDADVALIDSKVLGKLQPFDLAIEYLQSGKDSGCKVIWLDSSASSGTTHFQVLPYVAGYWKKQLLKDLSQYRRPMAGGRIYTDYYHRNMGCEIENAYTQAPLQTKYESKISVSWNLGVGAYGLHTTLGNILRKIPWSIKTKIPLYYSSDCNSATKFRSNAIAFRGASSYSNSAISYQRIKLMQFLRCYDVDMSVVNFSNYVRELKSVKIAVSPFGFGEICYRDFEVFLYGAALLKPNMNHQRSYPDFFLAEKSYIPISWDFNDLEEQLECYLENHERRVSIANAGQELLLAFRSLEGQEQFCSRFSQKVKTVLT